MSINPERGQRGLTLVELVIAIAVAGVLVAALMSSYSAVVGRSADPMIRTQTIALAESFMEEATLKPFLDPATGTRCPTAPASRANFNNVCDYNGYSDNSIRLPDGSTVASLSGYSVSIVVADTNSLPGIASNCALRIAVSVTNPLNETMTLVGYRTDYESNPACS